MSKRKWLYAGGAVVGMFSVVFIVQILFSPSPEPLATVNASDEFQEGTLVVSEIGEVSIEPDMAYIQLGAEAVNSSADDAQTQVNQAMESIRQVLEGHGVKEEHIQTAQLNVFPHQQFELEANGSQEEQYLAQHILEIEYREIDRLGELIDDVSEAGANRIEHTRFALQDSEAAEHEALQQAIEKTVGKADVMAKSANRQRGDVLQISDQQAQLDFPVQQFDQRNDMIQNESSTVVESGEVKITQLVNVVYKLR